MISILRFLLCIIFCVFNYLVYPWYHVQFCILNIDITYILYLLFLIMYVAIEYQYHFRQDINEFVSFGYWFLITVLLTSSLFSIFNAFGDINNISDYLIKTSWITINLIYSDGYKIFFIVHYADEFLQVIKVKYLFDILVDLLSFTIMELTPFSILDLKQAIPTHIEVLLRLYLNYEPMFWDNLSFQLTTFYQVLKFLERTLAIAAFAYFFYKILPFYMIYNVLYDRLKTIMITDLTNQGVYFDMTPLELLDYSELLARLMIEHNNKFTLMCEILVYR